jgi:hypothetical protein
MCSAYVGLSTIPAAVFESALATTGVAGTASRRTVGELNVTAEAAASPAAKNPSTMRTKEDYKKDSVVWAKFC